MNNNYFCFDGTHDIPRDVTHLIITSNCNRVIELGEIHNNVVHVTLQYYVFPFDFTILPSSVRVVVEKNHGCAPIVHNIVLLQ